MIYLHKLLPLLLSPLLVVIFLIVYGVWTGKRRFSLAGLFVLYLLSTPLIARSFFAHVQGDQVKALPETMPQADAIIVLSGMLALVKGEQGDVSEWGDPDRFFGGIDLYQAGRAQQLIFTGGIVPWESTAKPEGLVLRGFAERMGVSHAHIQVTEDAVNTEEEARAARKLFSQPSPHILLVTSAYHMPRSRLLFEKQGFVVTPYPVDFKVGAGDLTPMDFAPLPGALALVDIGVRELIGRAYYRLKSIL